MQIKSAKIIKQGQYKEQQINMTFETQYYYKQICRK